ncbi:MULTISPECIES: GNAT family N-acetyltransferase [Kordiimonas]|uniref:GNAT family N-acetyltransferase n=1 Tax=Kordiimonas TaxID=288021 RepID=UPI001FF5B410|nr:MULTISPECIES: GNAT family N-acetyltransferase [Kordiimonas]MCK0068537.1 GNAT family N-acetyltransferase [Kordiimonas laminariae]UTW57895.1 GNAT family N-acetyltransferase [Kordiimonas sp. SCSIO 12603]
MSFAIRDATPDDLEATYGLAQAMAVNDEAEEYFQITKEQFADAAFGEGKRFNILVAEEEGNVVGMATYYERFHIWFGEDLIEIDDLYVSNDARGHGIGSKLLKEIGRMGKERGVHIRWGVERENFSTIAFYRRMGVEYHNKGICIWAPEDVQVD